jgi:hypothetical protein
MALEKAGVYNHAIIIWHDKPDTEQTWDNCVTPFNKQEKQHLKKLTAGRWQPQSKQSHPDSAQR